MLKAFLCSYPNVWILCIQYGCFFGVELIMNNAAALYLKDQLGQTTETSSKLVSYYPWFNIITRGLFGGYISDILYGYCKFGLRGRIIYQMLLLMIAGILIFVFSNTQINNSIQSTFWILCLFTIVSQAGQGSTFGIVSFIIVLLPTCVLTRLLT